MPCWRVMRYCSGDSACCHSASDLTTLGRLASDHGPAPGFAVFGPEVCLGPAARPASHSCSPSAPSVRNASRDYNSFRPPLPAVPRGANATAAPPARGCRRLERHVDAVNRSSRLCRSAEERITWSRTWRKYRSRPYIEVARKAIGKASVAIIPFRSRNFPEPDPRRAFGPDSRDEDRGDNSEPQAASAVSGIDQPTTNNLSRRRKPVHR